MSETPVPVINNVTTVNPFDAETAPGVQLVVLMRIYDALMALLQATDSELHDKLDEMHESGQLAWSLPYLDLKPESDANAAASPSEERIEERIVPPPGSENAPDSVVVGEKYPATEVHRVVQS